MAPVDRGHSEAVSCRLTLDIAYQGFGDGIDDDAFALRALADAGVSFFVANSFSKSFRCMANAWAGSAWSALTRLRRNWCWGN